MSREICRTPRREFKNLSARRSPLLVLPEGCSAFAHRAALDLLELASASPTKIRLVYERNHLHQNSDYLLVR